MTDPDDNEIKQSLDNARDDETDEEYRRRVYGNDTNNDGNDGNDNNNNTSLRRRVSKHIVRQLSRRRSSLSESLPETPAGWAVLLSTISCILLGYEIRLMRSLSAPPLVFGQIDQGRLKRIFEKMSTSESSILSRTIKPSLFVGTRGIVASAMAYAMMGPSSTDRHVRFRETMIMTQDGATIGVDWELPPSGISKNDILQGPITKPVVVIVTGMNNDTSFGYIRSAMRTFTDRGYIACGVNFRGCSVPLTTPRLYNGAYTGDIRCVILKISGRIRNNAPLFLIGNSLGANVVTKYLGEEGLSGTLPSCVAGGISLGNPLQLNGRHVVMPWTQILALGVKRTVLQNWKYLSQMRKQDRGCYKQAIDNVLLAKDMAELDNAAAPILIRNEPFYPHSVRIGYKNAEAYWTDASSYRLVRYISVPFLQVIAGDDMIVTKSSTSKLGYSLANPNVLAVETRCGGHLGWQESPPDTGNIFGFGTSWADTASADFIDAVIATTTRDGQTITPSETNNVAESSSSSLVDPTTAAQAGRHAASMIRSRL